MEEEIKRAFELVQKDKEERQERAWKKINEYILKVQEEENVIIGIQPIQIQPQLTIIAK